MTFDLSLEEKALLQFLKSEKYNSPYNMVGVSELQDKIIEVVQFEISSRKLETSIRVLEVLNKVKLFVRGRKKYIYTVEA